MSYTFDAIVYGTVCLDLIWRVERLAKPGDYEPIHEDRRMLGGEAANTAMALARWGARVALVGTTMGDDEDGRQLRTMLEHDARDVDTSGVATNTGVKTPYCVCIATPDGHRTMYGRGFTAMQCPALDPELAGRARIFTMDPNAYRAGLDACAVAAAAGAEVVAMDYSRSPEVNRAATISVTSHEHVRSGELLRVFGEYAASVRDRDGCTTVVTCGDQGCFAAERGRDGTPAEHYPAHVVDPVIDSTGAGDVFRAGLIYGRLQNWDLAATIRFASAAAALNCTKMGGWSGVGTIEETLAFQRTTPLKPAAPQ